LTQSKLAAIEEGLARAQDLYLAQSWDAMLAELSTLQRDALGILSRPEGCGTLWELEFRRGLGHGARKGEDDTRARTEHFAAAFILDATRRPLGDLYGPDVSAAFLAAVEAASARPARPTTITVSPPDARVTVDCRVVDATAAVPLVPGRHTVLVEAPGFQPHAETLLLSAGDPVAVTLAADETLDPLQRLAQTWSDPSLSPAGIASRTAIANVAAAQGAVQWIVLVPTEQGTRASLWREGGRRSVLEMANEEAAALGVLEPRRRPAGGALAQTVGPTNPAVTGSRPSGADARGETTRKPLVRRWWFWTALLGGAAAAGLGLGFGLRRDPTPKRLEVIVR
ncbi:MAG: hypothetical protein JKY37_05570, partial [Nannocystaceae bacterium]|nr:hypothetical protein [Nannocystaceae bacterium]